MKKGFSTIMSAQFFSSLADNALLVAAVELLRTSQAPAWQVPALAPMFAFFYVILAPFVGAFADADRHRRLLRTLRRQAEAAAHIDHRHDAAAQIHHTYDVGLRQWSARYPIHHKNILHTVDRKAEHLFADRCGDVFAFVDVAYRHRQAARSQAVTRSLIFAISA